MGLCATWWKVALCQYQRWDNFCIRNLPIQNIFLPHVNSTERRHLLDSKMKFGVWTWHSHKLAKDNNGVRYLIVRQDRFDRTLDAKRMKTKDSKETVRAFLTMITKKNRPKKFWVDEGTKIAGQFKNLSNAEGIQFYSTMSETKDAFAERTIRSLKNILYGYMEDNGYRYIHKLTQFVTTLNSRRNCSIDLTPRNVKNSDTLSILYSKPRREFRKPKFKSGDRARISKYDLHFRKIYQPQLTEKVFEIVAIFSEKPPTYTIKDEQDEIIRAKFHQKE